jgi:Zn-dependent M28 family amino/carboxypeptidase
MASMKICVFVLLVLWAAWSCGPGPGQASVEPDLSGGRIAAHTKFLASDLMEGRGPATRGEALATEYIATQFALSGLKPAGDEGSFFQKVPLMGVETQSASRLQWVRDGRPLPMTYLEDFVAVNHRQQETAEIDAEVVFVGHGIVAPEFEWDDYKDADVRGKVVLVFTNEPPSDVAGFFGGKALTYYGRWTFKYEQALRQGALGAIIIHTTPTAGYGWEVVRNSWSGREPYVELRPGEEALAVAGWATEAVGDKLFRETGKTAVEMLQAAETRDFRPVPLGWRLHGRILSKVEPLETRNVVGILEGGDPARRDEAILYTAHWDHLGLGVAADGDNIYNGAVDNATGCGILLELARAWAAWPGKLPRSIVFAAVGAEEGGLRGSEFYGQNPAIAPGRTAVNLNFDGLQPLGKTRDIMIPGHERTTLMPLVEATAAEFGLAIKPEEHPEQGYYYRSDHFSLARVGVPAFSLKLGSDFVGRPAGWGAEADKDYREHRYHQPSDEFHAAWNFAGLEELAQFGFVLGRKIAELPDLPTWQPGDEFLPARERSWGR